MYIIIGATGQVGTEVARTLLDAGQKVTVVTRNPANAAALQAQGAHIAIADIHDPDRLREIFRSGTRAFLLNPSADRSVDTDATERSTVRAIVSALEGTALEKVVAHSTYGAFNGTRCGDLTVLYEFETLLNAQPIPVAINRAAYFMSNWEHMVDMSGLKPHLVSFFPADLKLAMVAPADLGKAAAQRLMSPITDEGIRHVQGPSAYSAKDVRDVFAKRLQRAVELTEIAPHALQQTFVQFGFSTAAATAYTCMTKRVITAPPIANDPIRGKTTLEDYFSAKC